jgi:transposase-like protein
LTTDLYHTIRWNLVNEPYRVCRRVNILRDYSDEKLNYTPEIRERAVQLLIESEKDYPSNWAAITAIAPKIGCTPETLRVWYQKYLDQQNPKYNRYLTKKK